ncbi:MAG: 30S ribosomal protein S9 [Gemmatimonadetes bacterium]|nr:30S ribosomal protein S9 [Gemmatimonadota bacterium]
MKLDDGRMHAVGRRKTAVARVYLSPGKGAWLINGRPLAEYFPRITWQAQLEQPFVLTETLGRYDVVASVRGGGLTGQAEALRLAVARALLADDPERRAALREGRLLTRDPRAVERKKPGRPKARKRFQFSKR